jgi:hypothetical protein
MKNCYFTKTRLYEKNKMAGSFYRYLPVRQTT